ncbi:hypothetical protein P4S84_14175, partial [Aneurinibacillus aneurinilyticus]|nr:hypothetical protein [Aneurinibacillus aneurinilyticus]
TRVLRVLRSRLAEAKSGPASMRRRTDARLGHGVVTIHYGSYWIINTLDDELKKQRQAYLCFQSDPWKEPRFVFWVKRDKKGGKLLKLSLRKLIISLVVLPNNGLVSP